MKRIILMVLKNLLFVPYGWFKLCYTASHVDKYTEEERYQVLKMIDRRANWGGRITIDAHGVENIPEKDGFMFFPNHQGLYDVQAVKMFYIFVHSPHINRCNDWNPFFGFLFSGCRNRTCAVPDFSMYVNHNWIPHTDDGTFRRCTCIQQEVVGGHPISCQAD